MIEPFLKWAGGKRWLAASDCLPRPASFDRYIEPFLGGGAVFFSTLPSSAILSDINSELIDLYRVIRDDPARLWRALELHQAFHDQAHYYNVRSAIPDDMLGRAARTLYLNRTCWNGLYRVNKRGEFNVPIGTKSSVIFDKDDFDIISKALLAADLRVCDFADTLSFAGEGDFVFVDPPYTVKHNMNGFVKYNETIFSWSDQVRLCEAVRQAAERGASVVVTNADHASLRELYSDGFVYRSVERASVLSGLNFGRGKTTEALFTVNV